LDFTQTLFYYNRNNVKRFKKIRVTALDGWMDGWMKNGEF
jgi:hypothetical protein